MCIRDSKRREGGAQSVDVICLTLKLKLSLPYVRQVDRTTNMRQEEEQIVRKTVQHHANSKADTAREKIPKL